MEVIIGHPDWFTETIFCSHLVAKSGTSGWGFFTPAQRFLWGWLGRPLALRPGWMDLNISKSGWPTDLARWGWDGRPPRTWDFQFLKSWASLVTQRLKHLPAMPETWVQSLGREDSLEKEMQHTPVFLPWESHGQRSLVGYSPRGRRVRHDTERLHFHFQVLDRVWEPLVARTTRVWNRGADLLLHGDHFLGRFHVQLDDLAYRRDYD